MSDRDTSLLVLRQEVREFIENRDWDQFHSPKDLAIGLITESSEFLEHFRFRDDLEIEARLGDPAFREALQNELADCFYFILAVANKLEIDLSEALRRKMALSAQRYPIHLAKGKNEKYTAYQDEV